jgi:exopolysaccharide biosynthesis polyprenyl glycosylphosphotransferase
MSSREAPADVPDETRVILDGQDPSVVDLTETIGPIGAPAMESDWAFNLGTSALRRYRLVGFTLVLIDVVCVAVALLVAHALRFGILPEPDYMIGLVVATPLWIGVFHALGLYGPNHFSWLEEFRRTVSAVGLGIVLIILLTFWLDVYLSRSWMAIALAIALALELIARRVVRAYVSRQHARESLVLRTLVIGNKDQTARPIAALNRPGSGFRPLGYVDATSPLIASAQVSPIELVSRLRLLIRQYRTDCLFIASPTIETRPMLAMLQAARQEGVLVRVYTHLSGILASRVTVQPLGQEGMALTLKPAGLSAPQRVVKRTMDLVLAGLGLIAASPILLTTALAIRVTSGGRVLFRQERVTEGNRTFRMYKFRTMADSSDRHAENQAVDRSVPFFKHTGDVHVTRLGKWLRKWSLDELPQLLNVLIGDMSLVGPRPLPAEQVSANIELLGPRHEVRAGITGWWQIHGRSELEPEEAIRLDHFYIENWSPSLDIYILLRTAGALLTRRGAY